MRRVNPSLLLAAAGLLAVIAAVTLPFQGTHFAMAVPQKAVKVQTLCVKPGQQPHYAFYDSHKEWKGASAPSIKASTTRGTVRNYRGVICTDPAQLATAEAALKGGDQQTANRILTGQQWADEANDFNAHADWTHAKVEYLPDTAVAKTTIMMVGTPRRGPPKVLVIPAPHRSSWFLILKVWGQTLHVRIECVQPYGLAA